jgi:hypothetical protein
MTVGDLIETAPEIVLELGRIGKWVQAVGLIVVIWIVIQAITLYFNRKRRKTLYTIKDDLKRIERKIDKLSKKK